MAVTESTDTRSGAEIIEELRTWLDENWDADLTVSQWWEKLGTAGWAAPTLPKNAYGRELSRADAVAVANEIGEYGALGAPSGLGLLLAAPTIATHGSQEQIDTLVRDIVTGQKAWCQLFSEPGAGSDLAGLTTKAVKDGDVWVINGQKVWTSMGQTADMGMLLARTNPDAPKHQGISWMAIDMHQAGVEVRPLIEMTGHAMFNEVFMSDATVPVEWVIGDLNNGWAAANTTLANERAGLGSGGGGAGGFGASPGTIAKQLDMRVGDFVTAREERKASRPSGGNRPRQSTAQLLIGMAKGNGKSDDPTIRQGLAKLHTLGEIGRLNGERLKGVRARGGDIPGMANISKLSQSEIVRTTRDLGLAIVGAAGMLHAYKDGQREVNDRATGNPFLGMITMSALYAQAPPIYGGTDQIQRNIIGERALGLPKEPGPDPATPFSALPKNA
ncbi:MAG TPA: acyl-CoA dehydrogenase family protein [Acidimicrobiales bacterium]|nr:acyl-CoA dehydrogenase family protein [Acidimicrobiales bacterium]